MFNFTVRTAAGVVDVVADAMHADDRGHLHFCETSDDGLEDTYVAIFPAPHWYSALRKDEVVDERAAEEEVEEAASTNRPRCVEDEDVAAPRDGCRCGVCRRAREMALDPRLIELAHKPTLMNPGLPSQRLIHEGINRYVVGSIDLTMLYVSIIEALAAVSDAAFARELERAKLAPTPSNPSSFNPH